MGRAPTTAPPCSGREADAREDSNVRCPHTVDANLVGSPGDIRSSPCSSPKQGERHRRVTKEAEVVRETARPDSPRELGSGVSRLRSRVPLSSRSEETAGAKPVRATIASDRWTALQVSIPRLEVGGTRTAANVLTGSSTTSKSSSGTRCSDAGFAAAAAASTIAAAASPRTAHGGGKGIAAAAAGVRSGPAFVGNDGRGDALAEVRARRTTPLNAPPPRQPYKMGCPVDARVTEAGSKVYKFNKKTPTRHGRWSRMEEEFAKRIITDFEDGVLDVGVGVGLRNLLATKLHCDVMRVTKKFSGWRCVGKQAFRPVVHQDGRTTRSRDSIFKMEQAWLKTFEQTWLMAFSSGSSAIDGGSGTTPASLDEGGSPTRQPTSRPVPPSPVAELEDGAGSPKSPATPAKPTSPIRVERRVAVAETSTGPAAPSIKEELSEETPTGAAGLDDKGQEGSGKRGGRVSASPEEERGCRQWPHQRHHSQSRPQQGHRALPYGDADYRRHNRGFSAVDRHDQAGRNNWAPSSQGGFYHTPGGADPREPAAYRREHPGFSQERATWLQQQQQRRSKLHPRTTGTGRSQEDPREYAQRDHRRQGFREAPAEENDSVGAERGMRRYEAAAWCTAGDEYPSPLSPDHQPAGWRLASPGRRQGSRGDTADRGYFAPQHADFLRADSRGVTSAPVYEQVPKSTGRWRPCWLKPAASPVYHSSSTGNRVAPRQASPRRQQQQQAFLQPNRGQERWPAAKEGRRTYDTDLAAEAQYHRLAKAPRLVGSFSSDGGGSSRSGDCVVDDSDYPMYQKKRRP